MRLNESWLIPVEHPVGHYREVWNLLCDLELTEGQAGRVLTWKPRVLYSSTEALE